MPDLENDENDKNQESHEEISESEDILRPAHSSGYDNEKISNESNEVDSGQQEAEDYIGVKKQKNYEVRKKLSKKPTMKRPWTEPETTAVLSFFKASIRKSQVPGKKMCEECRHSDEVLSSRSWTDIKYYVYNYIKKINKH